MSDPGIIYRQRTGDFSRGIDRLRKPLRWIPWLRLLLFVLTGFSIYYAVKFPGFLFIAAPVISFAGFLAAGWFDHRLKKKIRSLESLILINRQELAALEHDFSGFDPGNEFINHEHPYTHDLDIFGKGSLFQYVNRTSTIFGKTRLADYLNNAYQYRGEIITRQRSIAELSGNLDFRHRLRLIFFGVGTSVDDLARLNEWLQGLKKVNRIKTTRIMAWTIPAVTIGSMALSVAGLMPYQLPLVLVMLQLLIVYGFARQTLRIHQAVTSQVDILEKYAEAFSLIEEMPFDETFNTKLQEKLSNGGQGAPGQVIRQLSKQLNLLDANLNLVVSVILNGLFMFNIHIILSVEGWRLKNRGRVPVWFEVLSEFDALSSLGNYACNNPGYIYPEPVSDEFQFIAEKTGHPLIPRETAVTNDLQIRGWNQFRIITGANMSGKSTFLRTIGCNLLLAMTGAPVFAKRLTFYPIEIHSSIRTNDSLARRESYFYAELRRLREIIGELESGRQKLILLDEILKGTNSSDKQTGSIALMKQLMKYKLAGLFATHDLALGGLADHYPDNISNLCFEIHITGDRMMIDYKLQPGVCRNLNASFLMKNMGIILEDETRQ